MNSKRGRKPSLTPAQEMDVCEAYSNQDATLRSVAKIFNISHETVRRIVKAGKK